MSARTVRRHSAVSRRSKIMIQEAAVIGSIGTVEMTLAGSLGAFAAGAIVGGCIVGIAIAGTTYALSE